MTISTTKKQIEAMLDKVERPGILSDSRYGDLLEVIRDLPALARDYMAAMAALGSLTASAGLKRGCECSSCEAKRLVSDYLRVERDEMRSRLDQAISERDAARKDSERLDWLDSLPDQSEFTPSRYGSTIREAIDSARTAAPEGT